MIGRCDCCDLEGCVCEDCLYCGGEEEEVIVTNTAEGRDERWEAENKAIKERNFSK
jgi:hypothetical protein